MQSLIIKALVSWFCSKLIAWGVPETTKLLSKNIAYYASKPSPEHPVDFKNPWKPDVSAGNGNTF